MPWPERIVLDSEIRLSLHDSLESQQDRLPFHCRHVGPTLRCRMVSRRAGPRMPGFEGITIVQQVAFGNMQSLTVA